MPTLFLEELAQRTDSGHRSMMLTFASNCKL
jgi:hypothetical protein